MRPFLCSDVASRRSRHAHRLRISTVFLSALCVLAMGAGGVASGQHGPPCGVKRASVYDKVANWTLQTLDGKELAFSDCKGKVVFLNFWATWCVPCIEEMPSISKLYNALKKEDIVFLIVSNEKREVVQNFLKKHPCDLPIYISPKEVPAVLKPNRWPLTFFLDRQGGIAFRCTGSTGWEETAYQDLLRGLTRR